MSVAESLQLLGKALGDVQTQLVSIQTQLGDVQVSADADVKESYDKGFADGKLSMGNGEDKLYSQVELDTALENATKPLSDQIAALQVQIDDLKVQIDAAKEAGKAELKASLKAAYEAQQVAESEGETGFGALLN